MNYSDTLDAALKFAYEIPGQTWPSELAWIFNKCSGSAVHVDVGSYCGRSLFVASAAMQFGSNGTNRTVHAVSLPGQFADAAWEMDVLNSTISAIDRKMPNVSVKLWRESSLSAIGKFKDSADSVFIDANHDYAECRCDIEGWMFHLRHGGLMCGHDYWAAHPGVMDAVNYVLPGRFMVAENTRIWFSQK